MSSHEQNNNTLWSWSELEQACGLTTSGLKNSINGISIDSRSVADGDLFIALSGDPGPRFKSAGSQGLDGHDFIESAAMNGASGLMVSKQVSSDKPLLAVPDTLDGLWHVGAAGRARMDGQVIAITGSSGKTTLRQWAEEILSAQAHTHASIGSFNNHWGVPLSLARMPIESDYGIFEIGMNHPGEISPLAKLVKPNVAVVLNVLPAHIGQFESLEHIKTEKLSIAEGLSSEGVLILPDDMETSQVTVKQIVTFGFNEHATVQGRIVSVDQKLGITRVEAIIAESNYEYSLVGNGEHRVLTSLAAMAIAYSVGADLDAAAKTLSQITTPKGRGNQIRIDHTVLVDDSYNANPVSMSYALRALRSSTARLKIAVLGEMFELGDDRDRAHLELQSQCSGLDRVITVGGGFEVWEPNILPEGVWQHFEKTSDIPLDTLVPADGTQVEILVKGSNKVFWVPGFVDELEKSLRERQA